MGSCMSTAASDVAAASSSAALPCSGSKRQRKSGGKRSALFEEAKSDEALRRIPGRMFSNGASGVASLFTQQGRKGTNQDAMIVWENFCSRSDTIFCGVFDGHGPYGHMVSRQVRDSLPLKLSSHMEVKVRNDGCKENRLSTAGSMNSEESASINMKEEARASVDFEEKEKHPEMFMVLKQSFLKVFKVMDKELRLHPNIDCFCSGTTAVTLVKQGQDLVIGNVGDSRAILGTRDQDNCLIAVQLTVDLKPNLPREEERIRRCKGRVFALQDEPDVARLWLPDSDSPGLAMARAFGDFCLKDFGLISVPDMSYRCITERDEFIVLATDGVWDVLSNEEVVDIVASARVRSFAARSLVEAAVLSWRTKYPTSKIDDCAVVCLFLNSDESISTSSTEEVDNNTELIMPSCLTSLERSATFCSSGILPTDSTEVEGVARVDTLLTLPRFVSDANIKKID